MAIQMRGCVRGLFGKPLNKINLTIPVTDLWKEKEIPSLRISSNWNLNYNYTLKNQENFATDESTLKRYLLIFFR